MADKHDLRDEKPNAAAATPDLNDVKFAGAENRKVMPGSGKLASPDVGNVVPGQGAKSS